MSNLYNSFFYEVDDIKWFGINKADSNGNIIWTKYYEENVGYSYPWEIIPTIDNHLTLSYTIRYADEFAGYPRTIKIDTAGTVVWTTDIFEEIKDGTTPIWQAQLSDSNIVQSYRVDRSSDPEFIANDWYGYPTRLLWLNSNGEQINEQLIIHDAHHKLTLSNLISGKGDYFFAIGDFEQPNNEYYGLITKYSNDGNVIWSRLYRHPDFNQSSILHYIRDLVELEDGSLAFVGLTIPVGEGTNLWLMKLNSEGCLGLGTNLCGEMVIGNSTSTENFSTSSISIFPNPNNGFFKMKGLESEHAKQLNIYNTLGQLVLTEREPDLDNINISAFQPGIYFVNIHLENTSIKGLRLVKY